VAEYDGGLAKRQTAAANRLASRVTTASETRRIKVQGAMVELGHERRVEELALHPSVRPRATGRQAHMR
jgi:hypothetical protein